MKLAVIGLLVAVLAVSCGNPVSGQAPPAAPLAPDALREWLTVLSSDEFEGRATFSPGIDKAAASVAAGGRNTDSQDLRLDVVGEQQTCQATRV